MRQLIAALMLFVSLGTSDYMFSGRCDTWHLTGYSSDQWPGKTADGTPTKGNEFQIVAMHVSIPFDSHLSVTVANARVNESLYLRVADRGLLGPNDADLLTRTDEQAFARTGNYFGCVS